MSNNHTQLHTIVEQINKDHVMNIYDTLMLCTYHIENSKDIVEDDDDNTKEEEDYLRHMLYNVQLSQIFKIEDGTVVTMTYMLSQIEQLYNLLKDIEFVDTLLSLNPHTKLFMNNKDVEDSKFMVFQTLFSFDYFHLFHKCLINYYSSIQSEDTLTKSINNLISAFKINKDK